MKKVFIALILCLIMVVSLLGCTPSDRNNTTMPGVSPLQTPGVGNDGGPGLGGGAGGSTGGGAGGGTGGGLGGGAGM